ncbi:extracellular solute-binding protein [Curtobacterium flaccumfaciens]|nr:extracellular solute-binding protein [Curtobacterium flaccumfaciens]
MDPEFYVALTNKRAKYTDAKAVEAMDTWSDLYEGGVFSAPDVSTATVPGLVQQKKFGMLLYGTFTINSLIAAGVTGEQVGLFMLPPSKAEQAAVFVESGALCVPQNAHKHEAAMRVAGDWLADDVQQAWADFLGDTSPNPAVLPRKSFVGDIATIVREQDPTQLTRYWEASPPALVESNVQSLGSFMVHPSPGNARATLAEMQQRADTEWKTWEAA